MYRCERGNAAIEFALVGPVLILMLVGILCYGGYFWLAHTVQQTANDSARAAVAGLDANERQSLAQTTMQADLAQSDYLSAKSATLNVASSANAITVQVSYDASNAPFWLMKGLLPMPSTTIVRSATIRIGGY